MPRGENDELTATRGRDRHDAARARIRELGLDAYEVGGSLRDELAGKEAKDLDVCVVGLDYARLERLLSREGKTMPLRVGGHTVRDENGTASYEGGQLVGLRLWSSWTPREGLEFALARREVSNGPGHRAFTIAPGSDVTIQEDLSRRDFTVNAIARCLRSGRMIDPYGGARDLRERRLRTVSADSFRDDALRILRGLVRVSQDGLRPDEETLAEMTRWHHELERESPERVYAELERIVGGDDPARALRIARDIGLLGSVGLLPELGAAIGYAQESRYHDLTCDEHLLAALAAAVRLDADLETRLTALLHDIGKPQTAWRGEDGRLHYYANPDDPRSITHELAGAELARLALRRLRAPRAVIDEVSFLVGEHMYKDDHRPSALRARRFLARVGRERALRLLKLRRADYAAKGRDGLIPVETENRITCFEAHVRRESAAVVRVSELAIDGNDLLEHGYRGTEIGEALREFLREVIVRPDLNERERLLDWAKRRAEKLGVGARRAHV